MNSSLTQFENWMRIFLSLVHTPAIITIFASFAASSSFIFFSLVVFFSWMCVFVCRLFISIRKAYRNLIYNERATTKRPFEFMFVRLIYIVAFLLNASFYCARIFFPRIFIFFFSSKYFLWAIFLLDFDELSFLLDFIFFVRFYWIEISHFFYNWDVAPSPHPFDALNSINCHETKPVFVDGNVYCETNGKMSSDFCFTWPCFGSRKIVAA